jgi:nucleotide-binding universal stress UspA family protein
MNSQIFHNVLCPVDLSDISAGALRTACKLAGGMNARLTVVYANWFEAPPYFTSAKTAEIAEEFRQSSRLAYDALAEFVNATLGDCAAAAELRVIDGLPVDSILGLLDGSFDLVVLGTHGRGGVRRSLLGSVTERVIRESTVPVLTVREAPAPALRNVLCAVDDTELSRRALSIAGALSAAFGARLTVLHVHEAGDSRPVKDLCAWIPAEERARCSVEELERHGNAAEEIVRVASEESPDLLVIGAPRRAFFEGMVLGSTTIRTVRHALCPVLTVPPSAAA